MVAAPAEKVRNRPVRPISSRYAALLDGVQNAQGDEVAVRGRVRDVARAQEGGRGEASTHGAQIGGGLRQGVRPRRAVALGVGRGEEDVPPLRIEVAIVPACELVHHGASGWVNGHVLDQAFAHDIDPAPIAQGLSILGTGSHVP